jgi:hypothetical protein
MSDALPQRNLAKIVAKALFYSSIQASIGSVEMSSKFSVLNFAKDQETLQRAADALRNYMKIGIIWSAGSILALYSSYGMCGAWLALASNLLMMLWIIVSYIDSFAEAAKRYSLQKPILFTAKGRNVVIAMFLVLVGVMAYMTVRGY